MYEETEIVQYIIMIPKSMKPSTVQIVKMGQNSTDSHSTSSAVYLENNIKRNVNTGLHLVIIKISSVVVWSTVHKLMPSYITETRTCTTTSSSIPVHTK